MLAGLVDGSAKSYRCGVLLRDVAARLVRRGNVASQSDWWSVALTPWAVICSGA